MSFGCLSYRNGKYQGFLNGNLQRHGLGILVDDDLTFHVSNWQENRMQGPTLLYLTHAKYIYGEWKNNQPHGLNVYRSGDTVLLAKYVFGVPSGRCLLIFERHGFACVLGEQGKQWVVVRSGALGSHSALMKMIELLQVDVPEHYLSLIKFACAFSSSHNAIRTFPCHHSHCYFGYINGLAIVFNNNNAVVTVGQHRNEELSQFGGRFLSKKMAEEGNFASKGEIVQYKGDRPTQKIYQVYQRLHKRDPNFINQAYEARTKVFSSIQSLIINKLKSIVQESRRNESTARFDINDSLDYHEYNEEESLKLVQMRDKMYSPPKKVFEKQQLSRTPSKPELPYPPSSQPQSLLKKPIKKPSLGQIFVSTGSKVQKENKGHTPSKTEKTRGFCGSSKAEGVQSNFTETKRAKERPESTQLYQRINQLCAGSASINFEENSRQPREFFPIQKDLLIEFTEGYNRQDSNHLEETSTFKRILQEEEEIKQCIKTNIPNSKARAFPLQHQPLPQQSIQTSPQEEAAEQPPKQKSSYKKREKSIQQFARPTYQDIEERRKRILRDFQELNSPPQTTPKKEKPKIADSPCQSHQISVQPEEQSSFGYVPLSISNRLNQKREAGKLKQDKPVLTGKFNPMPERHTQQENLTPQGKTSLQDSIQQERSRDRSSTRRANYNYGGVDSRAIPAETRDPGSGVSSQQMTISPARQKRAYQYMFE